MPHWAARWPTTTSVSVLGVDTDVLVRFFADDDDVQSAQAKRFFTGNQPIYVSMLVLAETFNVLTTVRKFPASAVPDSFRLLLRSPGFELENPSMVAAAVDSTTATFDHRAARLESMQRVESFL